MKALPMAFALLLAAGTAYGADAGPVAAPPDQAVSNKVTAQMRYNEGEAFAREQKWPFAESAYLEATKIKKDFPEAWNGLGHARKMQRKFPDALTAYQEALRLKPDFPQALESLGEAYVAMGKPALARATLAKLQRLDAGLAQQLAQASEGK